MISTATFHLILNRTFSHKGQNNAKVSSTPGSPNFMLKKIARHSLALLSLVGLFIYFVLYYFSGRAEVEDKRDRRLEDSKRK